MLAMNFSCEHRSSRFTYSGGNLASGMCLPLFTAMHRCHLEAKMF